MRTSTWLAAFGVALGLATPAFGTSFATLSIDGADFDIPLVPGTSDIRQLSLADPEYLVMVSAVFTDPRILYAVSIIDLGAPTTFSFAFSQSIAAPIGAPGVASASFSGSTTDGGGSPGVTITPVPPPGTIPVDSDGTAELAVYSLSTDGGTTFSSAGIDLGPAFPSGPGSDVYGPFAGGGPGPAASGSYDLMRVDVSFSLSGSQDVFTFNGEAVLVPEPATLCLLGSCLTALGIARRRRGRAGA